MSSPEAIVSLVPPAEAADIIAIFCDAFRDYPVMRYVLGAPAPNDAARLERLIQFFVMARALRGEAMFGVRRGGVLVAAATTSNPAVMDSPRELTQLREACWADLGAEARARYERCGTVWQRLTVRVPHVHLNMIGVRRDARGAGFGRELLRRVQSLSRETPGSQGVTLTTEDPANVPLYQHAGYQVVGHARIAPQLETWSFFRLD